MNTLENPPIRNRASQSEAAGMLNLFSAGEEFTSKDFAEALGKSQSEAHRMLHKASERGRVVLMMEFPGKGRNVPSNAKWRKV